MISEKVARANDNATLEELLSAAKLVEEGIPLTPELDEALRHGSSIGGARPKALIQADERKYVAKFSATGDVISVVKSEYIMMRLASEVGLNVAPVRMVKALDKDVLLIERFDRIKSSDGWTRQIMVSALTLLGLDDTMVRYTSYEDLTHIIRRRFADPKKDLSDLYGRLVFNILCGNTDDHARNHAAFFDGKTYRLTPAYDICPQTRNGNIASQGMLIKGRENQSQIALCLEAAGFFLLKRNDAKQRVMDLMTGLADRWESVCEASGITPVDRNVLATRQVFNPFIFEGLETVDQAILVLANRLRAKLPIPYS